MSPGGIVRCRPRARSRSRDAQTQPGAFRLPQSECRRWLIRRFRNPAAKMVSLEVLPASVGATEVAKGRFPSAACGYGQDRRREDGGGRGVRVPKWETRYGRSRQSILAAEKPKVDCVARRESSIEQSLPTAHWRVGVPAGCGPKFFAGPEQMRGRLRSTPGIEPSTGM